MPEFVPTWKLGLRWYSVQAQIVSIAFSVLMLGTIDNPFKWVLWGQLFLQISALFLRFVAQPKIYEGL